MPVETFLIVARCAMDEIPMQLFDDLEDAKQYAETITFDSVNDAAGCAYGIDVSIIVNIWCVKFVNGVPVDGLLVKEFEG